MPRNPATKAKNPKPNKPKPAIEPREERGVSKVAEPLGDVAVRPGIETHLPPGVAVHIDPDDPVSEKLLMIDMGEEPPALPVQVIERRIETVTIKVPLGEPPHRFDQIHIEVLLHRDDAHTFARLRQALRDQDARTADGREVRSGPDIIRWLMEQLASC